MASIESGLELFTNWQTVALGLTIYVMTAAVRRVLETSRPQIIKSKWWREVFLPLGPIANGIILALIARSFPWPEPVAVSLSSRVMYALVCGLGCGWLYGRFRGLLKKDDTCKTPDNDVVSLDSVLSDTVPSDTVPSDTVPPAHQETSVQVDVTSEKKE